MSAEEGCFQRQNSYQRDSAPSGFEPDSNISRSNSGRRPSVSQRSSTTTTASSSSFTRRKSRRFSFIMSIRRAFAFNIEDNYEPTNVRDEESETFADDDEINNNPNLPSRDPCRCRNLVLFAIILGILIAAPVLSKRRSSSGGGDGSKKDTPSMPGTFPETTTTTPAPTLHPLPLEDVLGTCRDPIMNLKSFSTIDGVKSGAVAADHPLCSKMGTMVMRDMGGNAVDAAVTVALCLGELAVACGTTKLFFFHFHPQN